MPLLRSKKDTKAVRKSTKKPKKSKKSSKKSSTPARTTKPLNRRSLRNQTTKQSNSKQKTIASSSSSSRSSESGSNNKKRVSKRLASSDSSIEIALSSGSSSAFSSPRLPLQNAKTDKRVKKSEKSGKKDGKKGEKSEKSGKKGEKKGDKSEKISKKAKVEKTTSSPKKAKVEKTTSSPKKSSEKSPSSSPKKSSEKSQKTLQVRTVTGTSSKTIKLARQVLNQVKQQNGLNQLPEAVVIESAVFNPRVTHRKRTPWSPRETRDLMKGVEKYGEGKWALILQDKSFNFHGIRTAVDLKDKYRNMTSYVEYKNRPMRKFVLVDSRHQPILTPSGGQTILNNR